MYYDHYLELPVCIIYAKWISMGKISYLIGIRSEMYDEFPYIYIYLFIYVLIFLVNISLKNHITQTYYSVLTIKPPFAEQ
jgi:hypothetical protein